MSLSKCFNLHGKTLTGLEKSNLRDAVATYRKEDLSHKEAAAEALLDYLQEIHEEANGYRQQAGLEAVPFDRKGAALGLKPDAKFQFAGAKARGADTLKLAEARKLQKAGKTQKEIWEATGWWEMLPGEWSFEISDAKVNEKMIGNTLEVLKRTGKKITTPLEYVINHPKLFAAYPGLKQIKVVFDDLGPGRHGWHDPDSNTIMVNYDQVPMEAVVPLLMHEVQHAIQAREGFSRGGSVAGSLRERFLSIGRVSTLRNRIFNIAKKDTGELGNLYKNFENTLSTDFLDKIYFEEALNNRKTKKIGRQLVAHIRHIDTRDDFKTYLALGGEVQARLTQERLKMSEARRKKTPPWVTLHDMLVKEGLMAQGEDPRTVAVSRPPNGAMKTMSDVRAQRTAPNGEPSRLNELQWKQARTPEFKKWFGDWENNPEDASKVVDENGEPLAVYHWSDSGKIKEFKVSEKSGMVWFSESSSQFGGDAVYPVFLNAKNPLDIEAAHAAYSLEEWEDILDEAGVDTGGLEFDSALDEDSEYTFGYLVSNSDIDLNDDSNLADIIKKSGFDSIKAPTENIRDGRPNWVVFTPSQIKSAIGNTGAFSSDNPDIRFQRPFPPGQQAGPAAVATHLNVAQNVQRSIQRITDPFVMKDPKTQMSAVDRFKTLFADAFDQLASVQRSIEDKAGKALPDEMNPHLVQETMHGKVLYHNELVKKRFLDPIMEIVGTGNLGQEQTSHETNADLSKQDAAQRALIRVGSYLMAKHALERNAAILAKGGNADGSGISDKAAKRMLAELDAAGMTPHMEAISAKVQELVQLQLKLLHSYGMLTDESYKYLKDHYKYYVPLKTVDDEFTIQKGRNSFDAGGTGIFDATGRYSEADNPFVQLFSDVARTISSIHRNEVKQALLKLAEANPDKTLWEVDTQKMRQVINSKGMVDLQAVPPWLDPHVLRVYSKGEVHYIRVNHPGLARALLQKDPAFNETVVKTLNYMTSWLRNVNTTYNPAFVIPNYLRDLETAYIHLYSLHGADVANRVLGALKNPFGGRGAEMRAAIWRRETGKPGASAADKLYEDYLANGGSIGYFGDSRFEAKEKELREAWSDMNAKGKKSAAKSMKGFFKIIQATTGTVETMTRLATYEAMLNAGFTKPQAASMAKNVTVNFNKKGEWGGIINSLYLFANASIQGTVNLARLGKLAAKGDRRAASMFAVGAGRRAALSFGVATGLGFLQEMMAAMLMGEDDDEENKYDSLEGYVKNHNLVLPTKWLTDLAGIETTASYISIPIPYGYNVFFTVGRETARGLRANGVGPRTSPNYSSAEGAANIAAAFVDAFNPIGGSDEPTFRMLLPTFMEPAYDMIMNTSYKGSPLRPEQNRGHGVPKPASENYFRSASGWSRWVAQNLNALSGGDKVREGHISISPNNLDYMVGVLTGGIGRDLNRGLKLGQKVVTGDAIVPQDVPVFYRFMGGENEWKTFKNFYAALDDVKLSIQARKMGVPLNDRDKSLLSLAGMLTGGSGSTIEARLQNLRERRNKLELMDEPDKNVVKEIQDAEQKIMKTFLNRYNKVLRGEK